MQSNEQPSFSKEILALLWQLTKIVVPLAAFVALSIWLASKNVIAAICLSNGAVVIGFILLAARFSYKSKIKEFERNTKGSASRNALRRLVGDLPREAKANSAPSIQAIAGSAVRMPLDYLKPEPRILSEIPAGEEAHIEFTSIHVDLEGKTWVDIESRVSENPGFLHVKVQLIGTDGYVLTIPKLRNMDVPFKFTPAALYESSRSSCAPVIQVIQG